MHLLLSGTTYERAADLKDPLPKPVS